MPRGYNGTVTFSGDIATKILDRHSRERLQRFEVEIQALRHARESGIPNIVELLDFDLSARPPWYRMRKCTGELEELLPQLKGNPKLIARLMIPLAETLQILAALPTPIYHRDLKPANILYNGTHDNPRLVLADFGCAFLAEPDASRITLDHRAVGAVEYRAPEYAHGRVETVNASGDVFSFGKLLWYMCNGVEREVFPYTLWHPPIYNLTQRSSNPWTTALNLIVANCVSSEPGRRISYDGLIQELSQIGKVSSMESNENERLRILEHESRTRLQHEEQKAGFESFLGAIKEDIFWVVKEIARNWHGTSIAQTADQLLHQSYTTSDIAHEVIARDGMRSVWAWHTDNLHCNITAISPNDRRFRCYGKTEYPYLEINAGARQMRNWYEVSMLIYYDAKNQLVATGNNINDGPYSRERIYQFLDKMFLEMGKDR